MTAGSGLPKLIGEAARAAKQGMEKEAGDGGECATKAG